MVDYNAVRPHRVSRTLRVTIVLMLVATVAAQQDSKWVWGGRPRPVNDNNRAERLRDRELVEVIPTKLFRPAQDNTQTSNDPNFRPNSQRLTEIASLNRVGPQTFNTRRFNEDQNTRPNNGASNEYPRPLIGSSQQYNNRPTGGRLDQGIYSRPPGRQYPFDGPEPFPRPSGPFGLGPINNQGGFDGGQGGNGFGQNGFGSNGPNGFGLNGQGSNGFGSNGQGPNGFGSNGQGPNGFGPNGQGFGPNGQGPNGFGSNGQGFNGFGPNGQGSNGFGQNGQGPNGFGSNGQGQNGFGPSGLGPNGFGPNNQGPNGFRPNGQGPNGFGSNGNGPNGFGGNGPSDGDIPAVLTGPVPSWEQGRDGPFQGYDKCKCAHAFNCISPGIQFGQCDAGKMYCCHNSVHEGGSKLDGPGGGGGPGIGPIGPGIGPGGFNRQYLNGQRPVSGGGGGLGGNRYGENRPVLVGPGGPTGIVTEGRPHPGPGGIIVGGNGRPLIPGQNRPIGINGLGINRPGGPLGYGGGGNGRPFDDDYDDVVIEGKAGVFRVETYEPTGPLARSATPEKEDIKKKV